LDIKWINSKEDGKGNVVLSMDLKSKNKFINHENTKYVFRILTSSDNSTGYNITYSNGTAKMNSFTDSGNGSVVDLTDKVSFSIDRGDEKMDIHISKALYLPDITYYNLDAYSMQIFKNSTLLDYISELPGHPEYVNPEVEEAEDLDKNENDGDNSNSGEDKETSSVLWLGLIAVIVIVVIIVIILAKKKRK
jgi:hypothetical protein